MIVIFIDLFKKINYNICGDIMFEREELLIGKDNILKLKSKTILVIGVGGVGGYVVEGLVRCGVGHIILCDYDIVDITNINRQLIALNSNIGKKKIECFKNRILDINKDCIVDLYDLFYDEDNKDVFFSQKIDYIIDCCDTVKSKILIIQEAIKRNIPVISSMGTGNKLHPEKFEITKLKNTSYDPLAKKMRYMLKDNKDALNIMVAYSKEESIKGLETIGSISFVPSSVGLLICSYVILDLIKGA